MQMVRDDYDWGYAEEKCSQKQKNRVEDIEDKTFLLNETGRFSKYQDTQQIRENFKRYVADVNSGSGIAKKTAQEGACRDLEFFMINMINRKFRTYIEKDSSFFEDLLQAGRLGIIMSLPKYDPGKSMPTTYFFHAIRHEMAALVNLMKHETNSHMVAAKRKIEEVDRMFEKYGRTPVLHDYAYSIGGSFAHIISILAERKAGTSKMSMDDPDAVPLMDKLAGMHESEDITISKINFNRILQTAREIEPDEVIIQCFMEASGGMVKPAQLAEKYHRSPSEIKERIQNLRNLLRCHDDIRKLYPERFSQEVE